MKVAFYIISEVIHQIKNRAAYYRFLKTLGRPKYSEDLTYYGEEIVIFYVSRLFPTINKYNLI